MTPHTEHLMRRATETLHAAQHNVEAGFYPTAINRAYYACFYAARAALLTVGIAAKSHSGLAYQFRLQFVQTGRFPPAEARLFAKLQQRRFMADYDDGALVSQKEAHVSVDEAHVFVTAVRDMLASPT